MSVIGYTFQFEKDLLDAFKKKVISEGFTIQDGMTFLVQQYVEGRFDTNGQMSSNGNSG